MFSSSREITPYLLELGGVYVCVCVCMRGGEGGGGFVVVVVKDKSNKDRWLQVERGCNDKKKSCVQSAEWNEQVWFCVCLVVVIGDDW